jgi:hypothetical protein
MSVIARAPASPPAKGPHDARYFDARDLEAELKRTFQICHECRMCVGYCGSFPTLFDRIDRDIESGKAGEGGGGGGSLKSIQGDLQTVREQVDGLGSHLRSRQEHLEQLRREIEDEKAGR